MQRNRIIFALNHESFYEVQLQIEEELEKFGIEKTQRLLSSMLLEEVFFRFLGHGIQEIQVEVCNRFGAVSLQLTAPGKEYNPFIETEDWTEEDVDYYLSTLLKANRDRLGFSRRNGVNLVSIQVRKAVSHRVRYTLLAMLLGMLVGAGLSEFLPRETLDFLDVYMAGSIRTMFLNAMNMMLAPVVFFSIVSGITNISHAAGVGRLGGKMMGIFLLTSIFAAGIAVFLGLNIFSGELPLLGTFQAGNGSQVSLRDMFIEIVPKNLTDPVISGNMLQVIFLALLFGLTIHSMGEKARGLIDLMRTMDDLCLRVIRNIVKPIPLVAFLSMASLMFHIGMESLWILVLVLISQGGALVLMLPSMVFSLPASGGCRLFLFSKKSSDFFRFRLPWPARVLPCPFLWSFAQSSWA